MSNAKEGLRIGQIEDAPDTIFLTSAVLKRTPHSLLWVARNALEVIERMDEIDPNPDDPKWPDVVILDGSWGKPGLEDARWFLGQRRTRELGGIVVGFSSVLFSDPRLGPADTLRGELGVDYEIRDKRVIALPALLDAIQQKHFAA